MFYYKDYIFFLSIAISQNLLSIFGTKIARF